MQETTSDDGDIPQKDDGTSTATKPDGDADTAALIQDVADLVAGDRDSHGDAVAQQQAAADAWTWYLRIHDYLDDDEAIAGSDVARMMTLLKISRGGVGEYDLDHDRDGVGYQGIAGACAVREGDADRFELVRGESQDHRLAEDPNAGHSEDFEVTD